MTDSEPFNLTRPQHFHRALHAHDARWSRISIHELRTICADAQIVTVRKGGYLFTPDEVAPGLYYVRTGSIAVFSLAVSSNKRVRLYTANAGEFVTEAMADEVHCWAQPHNTGTSAYYLSKDLVNRASNTVRYLGATLAAEYARSAQRALKTLRVLQQPLEVRYIDYLLSGNPYPSHQFVQEQIGTSDYARDLFNEYVDRGWIYRVKDTVHVLEKEELLQRRAAALEPRRPARNPAAPT